ncbi:VOC family protein [Umezawaea endophytica]|uniref:VOC family protein n=1 Tax=Umezawaea endophytica TaxID=1654476 RepID=A0A9X2VVW4_9PSEU|nr:VOC family protein [Umezawaea endophytica]MCS7483801.1 VOC family protein [Umezawaea endophytica]
MRLDHINLCASDVPALTRTLTRHFGYTALREGTVADYPGAPNPGAAFSFLLGQDGSHIVVTQITAAAEDVSSYPPQFHFGLMQDTVEAVHEKHAELTAAGHRPGPISSGFEVLGATWTAFYCPLGDGLEIEINHRTASALLDRPASGFDEPALFRPI